MSAINRENVDDAKKVVDRLIPDETIKSSVLTFLSDAIVYANELNPRNWNINLDKNGKFVRFNVGQEYCIEMYSKNILVLALKEYLPEELVENRFLNFKGYQEKKSIFSTNYRELPDCLSKVTGSIGCIMNYDKNVIPILSYLYEGNHKFIEEAIAHTQIHALSIRAHSPAFIVYLSMHCNKRMVDPLYVEEGISGKSFYNPLTDLEYFRPSYEYLPETERQAVIQSRIGQGKFRADLIAYWGECAVTGCQKVDLLRASHIKPWSKANNQERLDVFNGLLLVPNLDAAFDAGYISFADDGQIRISHSLNPEDRYKLGINSEMRISRLTKKHIQYLQYHRKCVFRE